MTDYCQQCGTPTDTGFNCPKGCKKTAPMAGIVLTEEERAALKSAALMLRANLTEYTPPIQRGAILGAATTLEQLLARSGQEGKDNE